jgi:hypothetical protein
MKTVKHELYRKASNQVWGVASDLIGPEARGMVAESFSHYERQFTDLWVGLACEMNERGGQYKEMRPAGTDKGGRLVMIDSPQIGLQVGGVPVDR